MTTSAPSWVASVTPAEIARQRALGWPDFHPEDYCHHCGRPNPCWFADTAEWQTATGSTGDGGGILCPSCFCALWEQVTGKSAIIWRLSIDPRSRDARGGDAAGMREALAEVLRAHYWQQVGNLFRCACGYVPEDTPSIEDHRADAILPVVQRLAVEKAAEVAVRVEQVAAHYDRHGWSRGYAIARRIRAALAAAAQPTDGRTGE